MKEKLINMLAEYLDVDPAKIHSDTPFQDMGLDSLDVAELVMNIEDELNITLELSKEYNTIDKIAAYIQSIK